jgi:hypothetical protein
MLCIDDCDSTTVAYYTDPYCQTLFQEVTLSSLNAMTCTLLTNQTVTGLVSFQGDCEIGSTPPTTLSGTGYMSR